MAEFKKVAVLGAGVMGSGIAAHLAGAGIEVLLLDIVPPDGKGGRNAFAQGGKDKALKAKPAAFFTPRDADLITVGNLEDDLDKAGKCDLVIEVVKEDLAVKRALFGRLEPLLAEHTIVASNTSGLPIAQMMEGRSASMKKRFLVTHFFNPVRYMKLLEIIAGKDTDPSVTERVARFGQDVLGKGIVHGKDTPNFVANRIGVFAMMHLIKLAIDGGYTVEEVDAIFGAPLGRPKSAVFRTADVVGLDTIIHVANNCYEALTHDERREDFKVPALIEQMAEKKMLGDKTGGGFMKKTPEGIVTLDFKTMQYRPQQKAKFASVGATKGVSDVGERIRKVLAGDDKAADLARKVTYATLAYSANRIGEIADDYVNIDRGMRWGFGWDVGPFETWDAIGVQKGVDEMQKLGITPAAWVTEMLKSGRKSFYEDGTYWDVRTKKAQPIPTSPRELSLPAARKKGGVVFENDGATLYDIGDRIVCLELHTKMNAIDGDVITALNKAVDLAEKQFDGLVIGNHDPQAFSAGANIFMMLMAANQGNWKAIDEMSGQLQQSLMRLRYAQVPTVTAPFGLTLGGGAEISMHGAASRASAELYMGLVEAGVGLLPAGGGCKELLARHLEFYPDDADPFVMVKKVFLQIGLGKVSMSAEEARAMGMLSPSDGVSLNRDFLIHDAKETALGLARAGYRPPRRRTMRLPGASGYATIRSMLQMMHEAHQVSAHDVVVGSKIAYVLTGGKTVPSVRVTEQHILDLEREGFLSLIGEEKTRERMQYMLMNNKPLRN
ncbi:MAG TPA: 3-hydroxyacyl-CoA dehydrogenase/enoyl-CoA hydratase family protein [Polyangia bacterium]|nr:3-hydroxyacyl-CoA dehydrogenase/enoyl-CoA hydratase family protein [Polyangia bacterium]